MRRITYLIKCRPTSLINNIRLNSTLLLSNNKTTCKLFSTFNFNLISKSFQSKLQLNSIKSTSILPSDQDELLLEEEEEEEFEVEDNLVEILSPIRTIVPQSITLRPYQLDCEEHCLAAFRPTSSERFSRIGVSSPTGSGKTAIFTSLIRRLAPLIHTNSKNNKTTSLATKVLIIVGSIELARQAAETARRTWPNLRVEIEQGKTNIASGMADVTVATYQTLSRGDFTRLQKFDPNTFKAVIVDEAHHAAAKSYLNILTHFDSRINDPLADHVFDEIKIESRPIESRSDILQGELNKDVTELLPVEEPRLAEFDEEGRVCVPIIGFTATFGRADGFSLGKIFQKIVWHGEWLEMIKGKWLSELRFTTVKIASLNLDDVSISSKGDFSISNLAEAVDKKEVVDSAIEAWFDKASQDCKSTLVFAVNIAHIISITERFRTLGIDARFVHEGTPTKTRIETLRGFKNLEFPVLVNCGILTEGADFPAIDCVLLARPTKSHNLFLQMIGRGLRLHPGKESCLIIDLVGNSSGGLVCAPTLFGMDPDLAIENQSTQNLSTMKDEAIKEAKRREEELILLSNQQAGKIEIERKLSYQDYANVFDFVDTLPSTEESNDKFLGPSAQSRFAWVGCGGGVYVLELPGKGHMKITPVLNVGVEPSSRSSTIDAFEAKLYRKSSFGGPYLPPVFLGRHNSLPTLIRKIDADIRNHPDLQSGVDITRKASWRKSSITEGQRTMILNKIIIPSRKNNNNNFDPLNDKKDEDDDLNKAEQIWLDGIWLGVSGEVDLNSLNKGEASDIVCRSLNGGMGFLKKQKRVADRQAKKEKREKKHSSRFA